jgi:hypothetical protein
VDGSTGVLGWDVQAGALWLSGDMSARPVLANGQWALERDENRQQVRAGGGFGKDFTVLGVPQRLRLDFEGFWQSDPVGSNLLKDTTRHAWSTLPSAQAALHPTDEASFLVGQNLYVSNQLSWGYVACMASLQKFIVQDLTLTVQALENLEDGSGVSTVELSWTTFHRFTAQLTGYWFWGADRTEETFLSGNGPAVEGRMGVSF